jgi:hypothetical protein
LMLIAQKVLQLERVDELSDDERTLFPLSSEFYESTQTVHSSKSHKARS